LDLQAYSRSAVTATCPLCGRRGQSVPPEAVQNLVRPEAKSRLPGGILSVPTWWLCPNPTCDAVYFSTPHWGAAGAPPLFRRPDLQVPVWLKEPGEDVPLCYCSGLTRGEVREAVAAGCRTIEEIRARTGRTTEGNCLKENPSGHCCHAVLREEIRRLTHPL
jgi:bacterioferritin-associated ferredoxin